MQQVNTIGKMHKMQDLKNEISFFLMKCAFMSFLFNKFAGCGARIASVVAEMQFTKIFEEPRLRIWGGKD